MGDTHRPALARSSPTLCTIGIGSVHFGLLGALEVALEGQLLEIARPKQRAVLAELLIHANA
ncbi:MAG: hypothetical protein LC808_35515, partial [Actinobacteria bacterium]|nr:hypothetical protein [Actinomycetota bacterium]